MFISAQIRSVQTEPILADGCNEMKSRVRGLKAVIIQRALTPTEPLTESPSGRVEFALFHFKLSGLGTLRGTRLP